MNHRNFEIDRLRAFAVLMTIYIHYSRVFFPWSISPNYHHGTTVLNIWNNSWTGVDLFLVISGFVISKTITSNIDILRSNSNSLAGFIKLFYIKRFYRIYPVAWSVFLFVIIASILFNKGGYFVTLENNIEAGIAIFTYTFNYYFAGGLYHGFTLSPFWSLSLEEQFYLLLPIFLILVKSTRQRVIILLILLSAITFIIRPLTHGDQLIFYTQTRCDGLIYGCLIYYLTQQTWFDEIKIKAHSFSQFSKSCVVLVLIMALSSVTAIGFSNNIVIPLACMLASLLVIIAASEANVISFPQPIEKTLDYLGSRSYSLYLVHFPMFSLTQEIIYRISKAEQVVIGPGLEIYYTLLAFSLIFIVSEISYRFIEKPLMEKGRKIAQSIHSKNKEKVDQKIYIKTLEEAA